MNRYSFLFLCGAVVLSGLAGPALAAGSPRPVVQENFQRLIKTNSCPSCDLSGAVLTRIDLSGANLEGANLAGARLYLADLSGANLRNANLQGAGLGGADLANADLRGANLTGAVLEGAYLKGALMDGVVTTRRTPDEDGVTGAGKTVFVGDGSRPKHKPYTQDVVLAPRQDLAAMPAEHATGRERKTAAQQEGGHDAEPASIRSAPAAGGPGPKRLSPMADAVVPATVVPKRPAEESSEVVELAAVAKEKVATTRAPETGSAAAAEDSGMVPQVQEPESAPAVSTAGDGGESSGPPAGDWQGHQAGTGGPSSSAGAAPAMEPVAAGRENEGPGETGTVPDKAAVVRGGEATRVRESQQAPAPEQAMPREETAGSVGSPTGAVGQVGSEAASGEEPAAGSGEQGPAAGEAAGRGAVAGVPAVAATVAGPQPATERRKVLVERLLDENQCPECDLQGADLSGRRLGEADLERADLRGANLEDADLENANLKGADLRGANLRKADLRGADLYMADLRGADLTGARMEGTLVDSADFTDAVGVSMDQAEKAE